jgi:molecular chaperone DnaJ
MIWRCVKENQCSDFESGCVDVASAKKSYYEILGVEKSSTKMEIKKAYYELAKKHHPDQNKNNSGSQAKFAELSTAYSVLSDSKKRKRYDQVGETAEDTLEEGDAEEIYADVLKDGLGSFFRDDLEGIEASFGNNVHINMEINFLQSIYGGESEMQYRAKRPCKPCSGTGSSSKKEPASCLECDGRGITIVTKGSMKLPLPCRQCTGTGKIVEDPCLTCGGDGVSETAMVATASIPPGVSNRPHVILKGGGQTGHRGGAYGDVFLKVKVSPHPLYWREGDDIHLDVPLNIIQASLGGTVTIPTLKGEQTIEFPPGVQSGDCFNLPAFGAPNVKNPSTLGSQINHFIVRTPTNLDAEQRHALENLNLEPARNSLGESFKFGAPVTFSQTSRG